VQPPTETEADPGALPTPVLARILDEQNPWHRHGEVPQVLARTTERPLAHALWQRLLHPEPRRYAVVLGARRVGKTTVMYQTVRHLLDAGIDPHRLWWMRLDHPVLLHEPLGDLVRAVLDQHPATPEQPLLLFLDEIVYARDWDLWLKTLYDEHWPVQVLATSSATAALRDRRLESGVGRWTEHYLAPYSFPEFLGLLGREPQVETHDRLASTLDHLPPRLVEPQVTARLRQRFLVLGGFPELLRGERLDEPGDDAARLLESQQLLRADAVERAVYKDIPQSFGVDSPMALERLLYVLAAQVTGVLSPSKIAGELGLAQPTVDRYLGYLTQAFLVFTLPNYSGNEQTVQRRGRKAYFVDGAVRNAALQRGLAPLDDTGEMALLLENAVAAALHGLTQHTGQRLYHWRDGRVEVDLVLDDPDRPLAFEVGSGPSHSRAGLRALAERHPRFAGGCWLVAPGAPVLSPDRAGDGIGTVPLDLILLAVGAQAAEALVRSLAPPDPSEGRSS
jgi:predicted AAA+ superfamily ATPase